VRSKPEGRGIRTGDLALFNIDTVTVNVFTRHALRPDDRGEVAEGTALPWRPLDGERALRAGERAVYEARKRRRGTVSPEELRRVAEVYEQHVAGGAPTAAVQMVLGYDSARTAARRVQQARTAGLLTVPAPRRREAKD